MMRYGRVAAIIVAVSMCAIATALWLNDGAWQDGAMPTKGVVRTFLFAGAGCAALLVASVFEKYCHRSN